MACDDINKIIVKFISDDSDIDVGRLQRSISEVIPPDIVNEGERKMVLDLVDELDDIHLSMLPEDQRQAALEQISQYGLLLK